MKKGLFPLVSALILSSCSSPSEFRSLKTIKLMPEIIRVSSPDTFLMQAEAVSRGELAYILETRISSRGLLELFAVKSYTPSVDISAHWAGEFIEKVTERNIMSAFPDGGFYPDDPVKEFQLAIILYRMFIGVASPGYKSDVYNESWDWAKENGFVTGDRNDYVSGSQAMESVKRFCDYLAN
ncbi:S-layer homology domain-containing protein [candidate division WOR-3 bacterium]|nr:S-layer homology domain-containing protein [candidate division WOR-3 bacterium]